MAVRAGMLGFPLFLLLAMAACTAALPLPPSPPPEPPLASVARAPATPAPALAAAPPQTAAEAASPAPPPTEKPGSVDGFAPETIARVRRAMQNVTSLSSLFSAEMASTSDPTVQGAIYADFEKKYSDAVLAQGLSMSTYLRVLNAAAKDPKLFEELNGPAAPAAQKPAAQK